MIGEHVVTVYPDPGGPATVTTTNRVPNPSFETSNTGYWGISNGTATTPLVADEGIPPMPGGRGGARVLKMVCPGANGQAYAGAPTVGGNRYTGAPWVYCLTPIRFRIFVTQGAPSGGAPSIPGDAYTDVPAGVWTRLTPISGATPAVETNTNFIVRALTAGTFYLDGMMVIAGDTLPAYFDGDTVDTATDTYAWTGTPHGSMSTRASSTATDLSCLVDQVTIRHGRDGADDQPDASSATIELSWDTSVDALPQTIEPGSILIVTSAKLATTGDSTRFRGIVTDMTIGWDDAGTETPQRPVAQIVAVGPLGSMGRRSIGDEPWPQELDGARVSRILTLTGVATDALRNDPGLVQVIPRDVDKQPGLDVARGVADSAGGILWQTRDGVVLYADAEHRRNATPELTIDACQILVTPTWAKTSAGLINSVSLAYGIAPDGGEQPTTSLRRDDSVARYGLFEYSETTELAALADAQARASMLTTRNAFPYWNLTALPVDMGGLDPVAYDKILALDMHSLVEVTGLPRAGSVPTSTSLWVEGIEETLTFGGYELVLAVTGYCRTSPPPRWNDVSPSATWDAVGAMTWDQASCIGPQPSRGRWDDVAASERWDTVDSATTWDTWKG